MPERTMQSILYGGYRESAIVQKLTPGISFLGGDADDLRWRRVHATDTMSAPMGLEQAAVGRAITCDERS